VSQSAPRQNSAIELVKSVLVIPVVVAIVMGIGFALARLAESKQIEPGKSDVRPVDVAADGSITLPMQFALITGQIGDNHATLTNWRHLDDAVLWHFPAPGRRYAVELNYACDMANAGSTVQIQLTDTPLVVNVVDTGGSVVYKKFRAGEVNLPKDDWYNLRISATAIAHQNVMNLRGVKLIPVKP
jgi:hypothetical protein